MQSALIYVRVSTQNQSDEGTSLGSQEAACRELAESMNVPVARVYQEVFTGAELYDRPLLSEVRNELRSRRYSHLICYAIDRLSRDPIHIAIVADECARWGVELAFVSEPLDSSPEGALIRYVRGYAAQIEREKIRERCIRGKKAIAQSGRIHYSGTDLYGYVRDRSAGIRVINDPEAEIVRQIFRLAVEGNSIRSITRYLNSESVPPPSSGKRVFKDGRTARWCKTAVRRILCEPSYKGEPLAWRWQGKKVAGKQRIHLRPADEIIKLPESVSPAIVKRDVWEKAQEQIAAQRGDLTRNEVRQYLLRGFIYCAVCGERMYTDPSRGVRRYRCSSREKSAGPCGGRSVPADACEAYVWAELSNFIRDPEKVTKGARSLQEKHAASDRAREIREARRALAQTERRLERLVRRFEQTDSPALQKGIEKETKGVEAEQKRQAARIEALELMHRSEQSVEVSFLALRKYCDQVAERLPGFDFRQRTVALKAFNATVRAEGRAFELTIDLAGVKETVGGAGEPGNRSQSAYIGSKAPARRAHLLTFRNKPKAA